MKADNGIRMIVQKTRNVFAKTCEMFILDMTSQAWIITEEDKRRTVQEKDIVEQIFKTIFLQFDNLIYFLHF